MATTVRVLENFVGGGRCEMTLRPSNLPKLAICACFEPNAEAGPAAERGTKLDGVFRRRAQGDK